MNNWIKCSDRLPDTDRYVLAVKKQHKHESWRNCWIASYWDETWWSFEEYMQLEISHWQELPALPEEGE